MNFLSNTLSLKPPLLPPSLHPIQTPLKSLLKPLKLPILHCHLPSHITTPASNIDIDMSRNKQGIYTLKPPKVVILWDLDNKPPRGPPYDAAMSLRTLASSLGELVDFSAYANRHAFIHLPQWVRDERKERRNLDILERQGVVKGMESYVCGVCGRKCKTNLELKKHFKNLHEREREKKLNRMRSLKGKKRQKYKERFVIGNVKYEEAARSLVKPKVGYGLDKELRRAGVYVKTVEDKPQSADWALKKQMQHSMSRGIDWLFLVSDDSDFKDMVRKAREVDMRTIVVGDWDRSLGSYADLWVPWMGVENGEIGEEELLAGIRRRDDEKERSQYVGDKDDLFSISNFDEGSESQSDLDHIVDELVVVEYGYGDTKVSAFSEGEEEEWVEENLENLENEGTRDHIGNLRTSNDENDLFWDSEDEEDKYY